MKTYTIVLDEDDMQQLQSILEDYEDLIASARKWVQGPEELAQAEEEAKAYEKMVRNVLNAEAKG